MEEMSTEEQVICRSEQLDCEREVGMDGKKWEI